jgi:hypothetical protein
VSVADALAGPWSDPQDVGTGPYTTLTGLGEGRYIRFVADFVRGDKRAPEIGPQAFGLMPLLTKFEVGPRCGLSDGVAVLDSVQLLTMQLRMRSEHPTTLACRPALLFKHIG